MIARALQEGRVTIGLKRTLKKLRKGQGKAVVVASNCPEKERLRYYAKLAGKEFIEFPGSNMELGAVVKKPFSVSALLIE